MKAAEKGYENFAIAENNSKLRKWSKQTVLTYIEIRQRNCSSKMQVLRKIWQQKPELNIADLWQNRIQMQLLLGTNNNQNELEEPVQILCPFLAYGHFNKQFQQFNTSIGLRLHIHKLGCPIEAPSRLDSPITSVW